MATKDRKIMIDAASENIPIFCFVAKDQHSVWVLRKYLEICVITDCDQAHINGIKSRIEEFESWQRKNRERVKLPD